MPPIMLTEQAAPEGLEGTQVPDRIPTVTSIIKVYSPFDWRSSCSNLRCDAGKVQLCPWWSGKKNL
jgi:hypothetical protein